MAVTKISVLPMDEQQWKELGIKHEGTSLFTTMSLVEGEILNFMDDKGQVTLTQIVNESKWPEPVVIMGVGGLVREGLVSATRHNKFVLLAEKN